MRSIQFDIRSYSSEAVARRFSQLSSVLPKHDTLLDKNLSILIGTIIQKNDQHFGFHSPIPRPLTKLPMKLFQNYTPNGPLFHILNVYFQNIGSYLYTELPRETIVDLFKKFQNILLEKSLLHFPKVFFTDSVSHPQRQRLSDIILQHNGSIIQNEFGATHKIVVSSSRMDESRQFIRVQQYRANFAYVHFWHYPDSYDSWISTNEIGGESNEPKAPHTGSWTVTENWVLDLEKFNEYMCERDYQLLYINSQKQYHIPPNAPHPQSVTVTQPVTQSVTKPVTQPINQTVTIGEKRPLPNTMANSVVQPELKRPAIQSIGTIEQPKIIPEPQIRSIITPPASNLNIIHASADFSIYQNTRFLNISQEYGLKISYKKLPDNIKPPSCSWFNYDFISETERRLLPELFNKESKYYISDDTYKMTRNSVIDLYKKDRLTYLSLSQCKKHSSISIDITIFSKIFLFLESMSIINYETNDNIFITPMNLPDNPQEAAITFSKPDSVTPKLELKPNVFGKIFARCRECSVACAHNRWHHQTDNFDLCDACFSDGKFEIEYCVPDFTHVETPSIDFEDNWTPEEELLLLKTIWKYRENLNWKIISNTVQSRSAQECLLHFIRIPSQEEFLESKILEWIPNDKGETEDSELKDEEMETEFDINSIPIKQIPFMHTENPPMAFISFIASQMNPSVAVACAKAVKEEIQKQSNSPLADEQQLDQSELLKCAIMEAVKKANELKDNASKKMKSLILQAIQLSSEKVEKKIQTLVQYQEKIEKDLQTLIAQREQH